MTKSIVSTIGFAALVYRLPVGGECEGDDMLGAPNREPAKHTITSIVERLSARPRMELDVYHENGVAWPAPAPPTGVPAAKCIIRAVGGVAQPPGELGGGFLAAAQPAARSRSLQRMIALLSRGCVASTAP